MSVFQKSYIFVSIFSINLQLVFVYDHKSIETYDVDPNIIGDGVCQLFLNVTKCGYDGGDCLGVEEPPQECTVDHPEYLGDGKTIFSYFQICAIFIYFY